MFQYLHNALTQARSKAFENEVRIRFRDGPPAAVGDVMTENDVVERERGSGPVREM